jgi:hypothetical protein
MQLIKIILTIHILIFVFSINDSLVLGQITKDSSGTLEYKSSRFSLAFLPAISIPEHGSLLSYSIGYGFNFNISYKLIKDIKISGNIEIIFSDFIKSDMFGRRDYKAASRWVSVEIGPKVYLNRGSSRLYLNSNFKFTQIYHGAGGIYIGVIKNPENTIGFNFGFGIEIPVNNYFKFEINPLYNILYPIINGQSLHYVSTYYKILLGLNYNFKI